VDLPALQLSVETNQEGLFRVPAVLAAPADKQIIIQSGGKEQSITFQETGWPDMPVKFIFQPVA
jgi:hypothetical protein